MRKGYAGEIAQHIAHCAARDTTTQCGTQSCDTQRQLRDVSAQACNASAQPRNTNLRGARKKCAFLGGAFFAVCGEGYEGRHGGRPYFAARGKQKNSLGERGGARPQIAGAQKKTRLLQGAFLGNFALLSSAVCGEAEGDGAQKRRPSGGFGDGDEGDITQVVYSRRAEKLLVGVVEGYV